MSFEYPQYIFLVIIIWAVFVYLYRRQVKAFFDWVKDHWFYDRSKAHALSSVLYCVGLLLLGLALLDLRGPEKHITGQTVDQKTIILIDNSASMLVEDVRPNRFNKALLLAKHYIKRAVGQKISLVVFSDGTKRIIPFTEDVNLIDARLERLKSLNLARGGTSLSLAIQESLQFFVNESGEKAGNILIFTDAEETDGGIDVDIPTGVSVGVVGIGTARGGPVPIRDSKGIFRGNKKHKGKVVVSKLDEKFLKNLGEEVENFKYWIATSYSLPTDKIISFFSRIHEKKNEQNSFRVRPVLTEYLMIPGLILLGLSFLSSPEPSLFSFFSFLLPSLSLSSLESFLSFGSPPSPDSDS